MSTQAEVVEFKNELPVMVPKYLAEIDALKKKHEGLVLTDLTDKAQLKAISDARKEFKKARTGVEAFMKSVRDGANAFSKSVIAKEKEIVALIQPEEDRLEAEEAKYEAEQERLAQIKRDEEAARANQRLMELLDLGFKLTADGYSLQGVHIQIVEIRLLTDEGWTDLMNKDIRGAVEKHQAELAEVERIRLEDERIKQEELERLEKQRQEQALKEEEQRKKAEDLARKEFEIKQREEAIQREEEERNRKVLEEAEAIKKKEEATRLEAQLQEEIRIANEKAVADALEAKKREEERLEAKRIADEEKAAKKAARQPDKKKLLMFAESVKKTAIPMLEFKSEEAKKLFEEFHWKVGAAIEILIEEAEKL